MTISFTLRSERDNKNGTWELEFDGVGVPQTGGVSRASRFVVTVTDAIAANYTVGQVYSFNG